MYLSQSHKKRPRDVLLFNLKAQSFHHFQPEEVYLYIYKNNTLSNI
jgi:hypothetical protein